MCYPPHTQSRHTLVPGETEWRRRRKKYHRWRKREEKNEQHKVEHTTMWCWMNETKRKKSLGNSCGSSNSNSTLWIRKHSSLYFTSPLFIHGRKLPHGTRNIRSVYDSRTRPRMQRKTIETNTNTDAHKVVPKPLHPILFEPKSPQCVCGS